MAGVGSGTNAGTFLSACDHVKKKCRGRNYQIGSQN